MRFKEFRKMTLDKAKGGLRVLIRVFWIGEMASWFLFNSYSQGYLVFGHPFKFYTMLFWVILSAIRGSY